MTYEEAISRLENHIQLFYNASTIFEAWLDTAIERVANIFGSPSPQLSNITLLKSDFGFQKILNPGRAEQIPEQAVQLIKGFIAQLEERKKDAYAKEHEEKLLQESNAKQAKERLQNEKEKKKLEENIPKPKRKWYKINFNRETKVYTISQTMLLWCIGIFVSVSIALINLFYNNGLNQGKTKFDQEKINLYDENTRLKTDTTELHKQIRLNSILLNSPKPKRF